jgi:hypothetical protein
MQRQKFSDAKSDAGDAERDVERDAGDAERDVERDVTYDVETLKLTNKEVERAGGLQRSFCAFKRPSDR